MNQMKQKLPAAISTKSMCFLHASEQVIGRNIHLNNAVNKRKTQKKTKTQRKRQSRKTLSLATIDTDKNTDNKLLFGRFIFGGCSR